MTHEEHVREVGVVELEVPLVVELEEGRAVGVVVLEVEVVALGLAGGVAALLAHVDLGTALLVGVAVLHAVDLEAVGLQGAALGERLLAQVALVGPHTCSGRKANPRYSLFFRVKKKKLCINLILNIFESFPCSERLTGVSSGVAFEIEGIVEAFAAEGAQVALDVRVALHVAVQEPLQAEGLRAHAAHELAAVVFNHWKGDEEN